MTPRTTQRATFTDAGRIILLEQDADEFEASVRSIKGLVSGVLVSLATSAVLLALNILLGAFSRGSSLTP